MKKGTVFLFAAAVAVALMMSCSGPFASADRDSKPGSSISVDISVNLGMPQSSRGLVDDEAVASVEVEVLSDGGNRIGLGSLHKGESCWNGKIEVSEIGNAVFIARAKGADGEDLYIGGAKVTLSGSKDVVTIPVEKIVKVAFANIDWIIHEMPAGVVSVNDAVDIAIDGGVIGSFGYLYSVQSIDTDFDAQIRFAILEGWARPAGVGNAHIDGAIFGIILGNGERFHISRIAETWNDKIGIYHFHDNDCDEVYRQDLGSNTDATSGKFRIKRTGSNFDFLIDLGSGWNELYSFNSNEASISAYFGAGSIETKQAYVSRFDNFLLSY